MKDVIQRELSIKEFLEESESKYKFFRIKYHQWDDLLPKQGDYQKKENVMRILDSPATSDVRLWVLELVDRP